MKTANNEFKNNISEMTDLLGFYIVIIIMACMAWIWKKLKDIELLIEEKDLMQQKHNKDHASLLSVISQEAVNQEWIRKFKAQQEDRQS